MPWSFLLYARSILKLFRRAYTRRTFGKNCSPNKEMLSAGASGYGRISLEEFPGVNPETPSLMLYNTTVITYHFNHSSRV